MRKIEFEPTYTRPEQALSVLSVDDIPLPDDFKPDIPPKVIQIDPRGWGGNHTHQRRELWIGYGERLYIIWRDEAGNRQEEKMTRDDGKLQAFLVASAVPHMIENRGEGVALLYELADIDDGLATPLHEKQSLR